MVVEEIEWVKNLQGQQAFFEMEGSDKGKLKCKLEMIKD